MDVNDSSPTSGDARSGGDPLIGQTVSHYEINERLGGGGMGVVYQARDTRLDRTVALKFLPFEMTRDLDAKARFTNEAKAASSLDHRNICAIHEIDETSEGQTFIAMAFCDGETLKQKIARGPLPLEDAIQYAVQIAEGLGKAHEAGIVHRDIKPANVLITHEGVAKIVDFGLAKKTGDLSLTQTGVTLGTAAYMSPEQASGKKVDQRTDIWSLGVVLYEMISGRLPFPAEQPQAAVYSILNEEPEPLTGLRTGVPMALEQVVAKCMAKDTGDRYQHADEVPVDLAAIETRVSPISGRGPSTVSAGASAPGVATAAGSPWKRLIPVMALVAIVTAAAVAGLSNVLGPPPVPSQPVSRFPVDLPEGHSLSARAGFGSPMAMSPDGGTVVYAGRQQGFTGLFLRRLGDLTSTPIPGTDNAKAPFFSPDGASVGFIADREVKRMVLTGGNPLVVADLDVRCFGATWGPDGTIVYAHCERGLEKVSVAGGEVEIISRVGWAAPQNPDREHYYPQLLPGGEWLLFTVFNSYRNMRIAIRSLRTGEQRTVVDRGTFGRYLSSGHLVYALDGDLLAAPFDLESLHITGEPIPVLPGVMMEESRGGAFFDVSQNGTLAYVPGNLRPREGRVLVWVDRNGREEPLGIPSDWVLRVSPDGDRVLVSQPFFDAGRSDLWTYGLEGESPRRLTDESADEWWAVWAEDGGEIFFNSTRGGSAANLFRMNPDGSGVQRLAESTDHQVPQSVSPDGNHLAFLQVSADLTTWDIWILPLEGSATPWPLFETPAIERHAAFSPDGRWIAYSSNASGMWEVYVSPFPGPGGSYRITNDGGTQPLWGVDGSELFFRRGGGNEVWAVSIGSGPSFASGEPRLLFEGSYSNLAWEFARKWDLSPDGSRFLMEKVVVPPPPPTRFVVIQNWFTELEEMVPTR